MHSSLNRLQAVFGFFTTVAFSVAGLIALSVFLHPADNAVTSIELRNVQVAKGRPHYHSPKKEEYAQIRFDLDADLSPLFNWNTKQLFVYVFASYPPSSPRERARNSEVIIWDNIIQAPPSPYSPSVLLERFFPSKTQSTKSKKQKKTKSTKPDRPGVFHLRNQKQKYQLTDISGRISERGNATLTVGWNVQPFVGALWWSIGTGAMPWTAGKPGKSRPFDFPPLKTTKSETKGATEKAS